MWRLKKKIKKILKKAVKRMYHWVMETGSSEATSKKVGGSLSEKKAVFINDIKFNFAVHNNLNSDTKRIMVAQMFFGKVGYYPNIENPTTFSEKVLWLKLFYENSQITICGDKFKAKSYIESVLGPGYTVPILKKYKSVHDISLEELPDQFVLKVNWCTGYNIIVTDKKLIDLDEVKAKLDLWRLPWKSSYYGSFNWGYRDMEPIVFAEEYINIPDNPIEYKLFCFNGKVKFTLVELDYFGKAPMRGYYDNNWNEMPFQLGKIKKARNVKRPDSYEKMIKIAEKLAAPFPYIRIDFYDISGRLYVGEMTFYSGGGFTEIFPHEWDEILGKELNIDYLICEKNDIAFEI